jgi:amino acid transporter
VDRYTPVSSSSVFFGCPSIGGDYGDVSAVFSIASLFMLFPMVVMLTLSKSGRGDPAGGDRDGSP